MKNLPRAASPHLIRSVVSCFVVFVRKGLMVTGPDGLRGISPCARYSKGSINFMKVSFFRVPSILWAMLPSLSMITVVGTTAMLP